jgi:cell division septation protein DedD
VAAAGPPRSPAVEAQSTSQSGVNQSSTATQQSPKEAEAALNALLADVTNSTNPPQPTAPAPSAVTPPESAPVEPQAPVIAAAKPAPSTQPAGRVTANTPSEPRPKPSARGASAAPTAALAPKLEQAPNGSVAAADGAYRIQLAAVRDEADARRAWDLFMADLGPVLRGVQPFIERADTANGTFYRVQIGPFANQQDAETLCDELKRRNASCFVIRH